MLKAGHFCTNLREGGAHEARVFRQQRWSQSGEVQPRRDQPDATPDEQPCRGGLSFGGAVHAVDVQVGSALLQPLRFRAAFAFVIQFKLVDLRCAVCATASDATLALLPA